QTPPRETLLRQRLPRFIGSPNQPRNSIMNTATLTRTISYTSLDKDVRQMPASDAHTLEGELGGGMLAPGDTGYDEARRVWNATVDRHPALIARCLSAQDVQAAVRFAAAHRMLVSVRGGGHHIAGNAVAEGGLMLDMSGMREIHIDPAARTPRVGAR